MIPGNQTGNAIPGKGILVPGNRGCHCANVTATLGAVAARSCVLPGDVAGATGIQLTLGGSCVPLSYGSSWCLRHDHLDPVCRAGADDASAAVPSYCIRPWCYVDRDTCGRESNERVYRSSYFDRDSGVDLFYSYSTCNSTADDWLSVADDVISGGSGPLGGVDIRANVPTYWMPWLFKRDPMSNEILDGPGNEYYNNSVPFGGLMVDYVDGIVEISGGDIASLTRTHRSRASGDLHPASSFTAACQDIADGLVDMSVGPFWITVERLEMTAFTVPLYYDTIRLVIKDPTTTEMEQMIQVAMPFTWRLWLILFAAVGLASLLSVWFSDQALVNSDQRRRLLHPGMQPELERRQKRNTKAYLRLIVDSCLQKGTFFCNASVDFDGDASLPNKCLMIGLACIFLTGVAAYVANLAAFMTRQTKGGITTMEGAVANGYKICAHPVLKVDLERAWPDANFVFDDSGKEYHGVLDLYLKGACQALAVSWEPGSIYDAKFRERLCSNDLVFTKSVLLELPIAIPLRSELASGFSSWAIHAERIKGFSIDTMIEDYDFPEISTAAGDEPPSNRRRARAASAAQPGATSPLDASHTCDLERIQLQVVQHGSKYDPIDINQMALPFLIFAFCILIATIFQLIIILNRNKESAIGNLLGRASSLRTFKSMRFTNTGSERNAAQGSDHPTQNETIPVTVHKQASRKISMLSMPSGFGEDLTDLRSEERTVRFEEDSFDLRNEEKTVKTIRFADDGDDQYDSDLDMTHKEKQQALDLEKINDNGEIASMSMDEGLDRMMSSRSLIEADTGVSMPTDITDEGLKMVQGGLKMRKGASQRY